MKQTNKALKVVKQVAATLALPVIVWVVMELIVYFTKGTHVISTVLDVRNLIRNTGIAAAIAFGISMNLTSGRMDLSLGAQRATATILGGLLAEAIGLSGIWVLIFAVVFGAVLGTAEGILFVTLRIPPMVLGVGMALIYECLGYAVSGGVGLKLVGTAGAKVLSNVNFTIVVLLITAVIVLVLMTYTTFSYKFRAVRGSQLIARNSGINIFSNVVICYGMAGALVAVSGVLDAAFSGSMSASMGMTSNGTVMSNIFIMMLGCNFLSKYVNQTVGMLSAALALKIFSMGLTAMTISDAMNSSINMFIFIAYLAYEANHYRLAQSRADKARIEEARQFKAAKAAAAQQ